VAAGDLGAQVEELYERIQLPESLAHPRVQRAGIEITARKRTAEREFLTGKLAKAETERRKLLDAYYGGAIDVAVLKTEQARIGRTSERRKSALR
jgi:hypothetical protein